MRKFPIRKIAKLPKNNFLAITVLVGEIFLLVACFSPQHKISEQEWQILHEAENSLNIQHFERGDFIQTGNFREGKGHFVFGSGHLRLDYASPHVSSLFADASKIIVIDNKSGARTSIKVAGTPFASIFHYPIRFSDSAIHIEKAKETQGGCLIVLSKRYLGKKGILRLNFSQKGTALQLIGLSGSIAGHYFQVSFQNVQELKTIPADLFHPPLQEGQRY